MRIGLGCQAESREPYRGHSAGGGLFLAIENRAGGLLKTAANRDRPGWLIRTTLSRRSCLEFLHGTGKAPGQRTRGYEAATDPGNACHMGERLRELCRPGVRRSLTQSLSKRLRQRQSHHVRTSRGQESVEDSDASGNGRVAGTAERVAETAERTDEGEVIGKGKDKKVVWGGKCTVEVKVEGADQGLIDVLGDVDIDFARQAAGLVNVGVKIAGGPLDAGVIVIVIVVVIGVRPRAEEFGLKWNGEIERGVLRVPGEVPGLSAGAVKNAVKVV
jgi:hypothetical protein